MKKTIRNAIILSAIAIVLVVTTVFVTVAYLTDSAAVANTFSIGKVGLQMFETKTNEHGVALEEGVKTSAGNHYLLIPGKTYKKDPTIYVESGSAASYLFIKVRNDIAPIEEVHTNVVTEAKTIAEQLAANGWKEHHRTGNDIVYIYAPGETITAIGGTNPTTSIDLFSKFTIETDVDDAKLALYKAARVSIMAYAIQDDARFGTFGSEAAANAAWKAIIETYPYADTAGTESSTPAQGS